MATYESVEKALIKLGFTPDVDRDRLDYDSIDKITSYVEISPESKFDVIFTYTEGFDGIDGVYPEEFRYELDVTAPDGFDDLIIFDGNEFDVVEMERLETKLFDYSQEKAFITDLHQKILKAIASVEK